MDKFTDSLWKLISADIFPGILSHPFIEGLTSGDLGEDAFCHYVGQDSAYLDSFGRGLALLAAKADSSKAFMMFCEHARNTLIVEEALHREFMEHFGIPVKPDHWSTMAPNALLYTSYLIRVAYDRPYFEGVAAFLPCYWIYQKVGEALKAQGSPNPLYQKWINTYGGEEFSRIVQEILEVVNELAVDLNEHQRTDMKRHFRRTSELEYLFWDMGYRKQTWPFS